MSIIIGNLCTLFAMLFNAFSSTRRTPQGVLWMQNVSQACYAVSGIVLRGYSATVQNVVSIIRNLAAIWKINNKILIWTLVALGVVLGVAFNNRSWIGLFPVIGNLVYTLAIFRYKDDEQKLKGFFLIHTLSFIIFNFAIMNYVGVASDAIVFVTTVVMLVKDWKKRA